MTRIIILMRSMRLSYKRMLCKFPFLCETRLDRVALDTTFNDTGRNDRGEERKTDSGFGAKNRAERSRFASRSDQRQTKVDSGPLGSGLI